MKEDRLPKMKEIKLKANGKNVMEMPRIPWINHT
jgi:hypothetical protein